MTARDRKIQNGFKGEYKAKATVKDGRIYTTIYGITKNGKRDNRVEVKEVNESISKIKENGGKDFNELYNWEGLNCRQIAAYEAERKRAMEEEELQNKFNSDGEKIEKFQEIMSEMDTLDKLQVFESKESRLKTYHRKLKEANLDLIDLMVINGQTHIGIDEIPEIISFYGGKINSKLMEAISKATGC